MDSCGCRAIEAEFDQRVAARDLRRYRQRCPATTTQLLISALLAEGVGDRTVLDIGGGVGAIPHALLGAGAARAELMELSGAYLAAARAEAERQGHGDRPHLVHGDFVAVAHAVPPADIVTLDRVVCCYPDMAALVGSSVATARTVYGLVYPRGTWWVRLWIAATNCWSWLRRSSFRAFLHPPADIDALVRAHGFAPRAVCSTPLWQVAVYGRA